MAKATAKIPRKTFDLSEMDLSKGFAVSVLIHLVVLLIVSITVTDLPQVRDLEPIQISIEPSMDVTALGQTTANEPTEIQNAESSQAQPTTAPKVLETGNDAATTWEDIFAAIQEVEAEAEAAIAESTSETVESTPVNENTVEQDIEEIADDTFDEVLGDVVEEAIEEDTEANAAEELPDLLNDLDDLLNESAIDEAIQTTPVSPGDELSDADWSSTPRAVLYFPDIEAAIPSSYKTSGRGYSLTAKIYFDKWGKVTMVDITRSSGDTVLDGIIEDELEKILVEEISANRTDTVKKVITLSSI